MPNTSRKVTSFCDCSGSGANAVRLGSGSADILSAPKRAGSPRSRRSAAQRTNRRTYTPRAENLPKTRHWVGASPTTRARCARTNLHLIERLYNNRASAQSIVEVVAGCLILIPIALFLLDIAVIVAAQTANNNLAKHAARAAAETTTQSAAQTAADAIKNEFPVSPLMSNPTVASVDYDGGVPGSVMVKTTVKVNLPVPVPFNPGISEQVMQAAATEPIVAKLAD